MSEMQINQVLAQMRALAQSAGLEQSAPRGAGAPDFANVLKQSLDHVTQIQRTSSDLRTAFETGDPNVSLVEVMVAAQKSSIAFEAVSQVRNRLLSAYQEVMRMQV